MMWYDPPTDIVCSKQPLPAIVSPKKFGKTCSGDSHMMQCSTGHVDVRPWLLLPACVCAYIVMAEHMHATWLLLPPVFVTALCMVAVPDLGIKHDEQRSLCGLLPRLPQILKSRHLRAAVTQVVLVQPLQDPIAHLAHWKVTKRYMLGVPLPTVQEGRETWYNEPVFMSNTLSKDNGYSGKAIRDAFTAADIFTGQALCTCQCPAQVLTLCCSFSFDVHMSWRPIASTASDAPCCAVLA